MPITEKKSAPYLRIWKFFRNFALSNDYHHGNAYRFGLFGLVHRLLFGGFIRAILFGGGARRIGAEDRHERLVAFSSGHCR